MVLNKKKMVAAALAAAVVMSPMAMPSVASAGDKRPIVWDGYLSDNESHMFRLEEKSVRHFTLKGVHYITGCAVDLIEGGPSNYIPVIGWFSNEHQKNGYLHFIVKFNENGSYKGELMRRDYTTKLKDVLSLPDSTLEKDWSNRLNRKYSPQNDMNYSNHQDEDVFDPKNWHEANPLEQSIVDESLKNIVHCLKVDHPDMIAENIAANKRDEAAALEQRKQEVEQKKLSRLQKEAAKQEASHYQLLAKFRQNSNSQTITNNIKNLGEYSWDMFLDSPSIPHPNIDINHLIHNTWYLDVIGQGQGYGHNEIVSFKPVFWYVGDTMLEDSSLLEMNTLSEQGYNPDGSYSQTFDNENFSLELARYDGTFSPNIAFTSREPENGNEKKIIKMDTTPGEGDYKTVGGSTRTYRFKPGTSNDDFWLIEYEGWNENAHATGVSYHLTKMN